VGLFSIRKFYNGGNSSFGDQVLSLIPNDIDVFSNPLKLPLKIKEFRCSNAGNT